MHFCQSSVSFDQLESRALLSGSSSTPVDPAQLEAARQAVLAQATLLVTHYQANQAALQAAREARQATISENETQLAALKTELQADIAARNTERAENEAAKKAVKDTWKPVLRALELDVRTDTEGETEEERAADYAQFMSDRATYREQLEAAETERMADELKWKREIRSDHYAIEDHLDESRAERKSADRAVKNAERTLKSVFQSDNKVFKSALKAYKKLGGDVSTLDLPDMPK